MLEATLRVVQAYADRNKKPPRELIVFMLGSPGDQVSIFQQLFTNPLQERIN